MDELLDSAATRAARYLCEIQERSVAPAAEAVARLAVLREAFPAGPTEPGVANAIVAIEDSRFYQHGALDLKGTLRALITPAEKELR